jgi:hypothetical protein
MSESENTHPSIADLTASERHGLLIDERRRLVLDILSEQTQPIELADLAVEIAVREDRHSPVEEDTVKRIQAELHHKHLPKMDQLGVVKYHTDTHRILI